ncbi:MAG: hypothetical protein JW941_01095, partial [Candidatus Coatesbacteria bacterium]|nr:hypothetical protein [Candidatus Coatesbacteria bacterium]
MTSAIEDVRQALGQNDFSAAVARIETGVSSGEFTPNMACRAALQVLSSSRDPNLLQRLSGALAKVNPRNDERHLIDLLRSICTDTRNGRINVSAEDFRKIAASASPGHRPLILKVWDAMELFNEGKDAETIDMLG